MAVNSVATPPRERAGHRLAAARTNLLQRDLFGVRIGVLLLVLPVVTVSVWTTVANRGIWNHPPDSRYYVTMMFRDMGHSLPDAMHRDNQLSGWHLSGWYFADNDSTWQMVRTRMLYPVLSIPFVLLLGIARGSLAVPILSIYVFVIILARMTQRLYGPTVALLIAGAFSLATPIFVSSWSTTDTLAMALAAVMVANLPIDRRTGKANLVWLVTATVLISLTRQVGPMAPAMAGVGWVWWTVRSRSWRNQWLAPLVASSVAFLVTQVGSMLVASADTTGIVSHGKSGAWGIFRELIHEMKIVTKEAMNFMWHSDHVLLALMVAAGLGTVARFKSDVAAVFIGAAGCTLLVTASVGYTAGMRYDLVLFPAAGLAAGAFVSFALGLRAGEPAVAAELAADGTEDATAEDGASGAAPSAGAFGSAPAGRPLTLRPVLDRFLPASLRARPGSDRWIPQAVGCAALLAIVVGVSVAGSFSSAVAAPASPSYAAAQGGEPYAVQPLARPGSEVTLKAAFVIAAKAADGWGGGVAGPFEWTHVLRYKPTSPLDPGWSKRGKDGTTLVQIGSFDGPQTKAFGATLSYNRTVLPDTLQIVSRQTSQYGEDVVFTIQDTAGVVHKGTATTLYPIWNATDAGIVTSLVFES